MLRRLAAALLILILLVCPYLCRAETGECCAAHTPLVADQTTAPACCRHCTKTHEQQPAPPLPTRGPCHLPCLCNGAVLGSETPDAGTLIGAWTVTDIPSAPPVVDGGALEVRADANDGLSTGGRTLCIAHSLWLC